MPLSKLAFDVYNAFRVNFDKLQANMAQIQKSKPAEWRTKLRQRLLAFFDAVHARVEAIKETQMRHLQAIVDSMSLNSLSAEIDQLQESLGLLERHDEFLESSFANSNFSTVAARFDQYKVLLKSMEVLSLQSQNIWALVKDKSD